MILLDALRWLLGSLEVLFLLPLLYLCLLCFSALLYARKRSRKIVPQITTDEARHFAILIPAHNEEVILSHLLESLSKLRYPQTKYAVHVVADNCDDRTAEIARQYEGVYVHERFDRQKRGKGYALNWLIQCIEDEPEAEHIDAYVVLDADSIVEATFLEAMSRELVRGARALQAQNTVLNTVESPSTVLRWLALTLINHVRQLGRNGLGSTAALTGNGMCLSRDLLQLYPWRAFSVAEDYQYYLMIVEQGERVRYVPEALARSHMPTSFEQMRTQDVRWEAAEPEQPSWKIALRLFWSGLRARDGVRLEAMIELLVPPLSLLVGGCIIAVVFSCLLFSWPNILLAFLALVCLLTYLVTGLYFLQPDRAVYRALWHAPGFMLWKLWVYFVVRRSKKHTTEWVRTSRTTVVK
ncbi:glycosyltransferase family 2 protein [Ktedonospora formicarum]|uniref:Glycosyl transferase n=1 Tax=Ktedonospora formicarum TaxID=2778364 RepID=A0A8J3HU22_9CHLR|nr:glycosyltransferase family 2 protein [Ktedonospora formicarum]GHO43281.1 glycosyl transferase [Ktedonospora formicarum]